jgi:hypothetical protein
LVELVAPLDDAERKVPKGTQGASAKRPPTTANKVRNLRLVLEGATAGLEGAGGAGGAVLFASFSDI